MPRSSSWRIKGPAIKVYKTRMLVPIVLSPDHEHQHCHCDKDRATKIEQLGQRLSLFHRVIRVRVLDLRTEENRGTFQFTDALGKFRSDLAISPNKGYQPPWTVLLRLFHSNAPTCTSSRLSPPQLLIVLYLLISALEAVLGAMSSFEYDTPFLWLKEEVRVFPRSPTFALRFDAVAS